jgi:ribosomal protein L29
MAAPKKQPTSTKTDLKVKNIKNLDLKGLAKRLSEFKAEADTLKRNTLMGDVQNVHAYLAKRREIARTLTAMKALNSLEEEK